MPSVSDDLTADGTLTEASITRASQQYDIEVVYTLTLRGVGISALGNAFTRCLALTHVDLTRNKLQSLDGIALLAQTLQHLVAAENEIKDVSGIDTCLLLEHVHLEGNQLSSETALAPLAELPRLRWLVLQREVQLDGMDEPLLLDNPICSDKKSYEKILQRRFAGVLCIDGHCIRGPSPTSMVDTALSKLPSYSTLDTELQKVKGNSSSDDDDDDIDERIFANAVAECRTACQKALSS
ncbi:uncharacterized protein TM35_000342460 [Trypanosoma theileri]|uniref:Leucine-rich repeat protein (LRRP) n=1 Tax=Trypanosoma theileri TaxID=67003 RepID=A0A1X0NLL5_9TRYP|nr:uncharacterized protein TM35_000342460 [Trypanosoma theileri]ORC85634.1 hypothetical protein TM35_000342460 [Trypanosoma theileri]